jgi:hypothetical protein
VSSRDRFSPFEFGLVICTAFGWYILSSVYSLIFSLTRTAVESSGTRTAILTCWGRSLQALITPALFAMLYARGWRVIDFRRGLGGGDRAGDRDLLAAYFRTG